MVSPGTEQQRGRVACNNKRTGPLSFPSVIGGVAVVVKTLLVALALLSFPQHSTVLVNGTVFLPEFNRSYTSLPGLFGKVLSSNVNDPPATAYLTMIPNQPYMCPDELKNIHPQPPPQFFNNNDVDDEDEDTIMDNDMMVHSNNNNNKTLFNYLDAIEPLPAPDDGLPIALLVERGLCTFWEKAELAARYGPAVQYVIIFDDIVSPDLVTMSSVESTDMTLLFVSSQSGHDLRDLIHANRPYPQQQQQQQQQEVFDPPPPTPNSNYNGNYSNSNITNHNNIYMHGNDGEENGGIFGVHSSNTEDYGDHTHGLLVVIDGERPFIDSAFPDLNMAAYFLAAMSGFLAFLIFFGCLLICAQCGCITAAPDEHGRIVLFAGGPGIRHTEGLARMIRVHKLTPAQVQMLDEEEFSAAVTNNDNNNNGEDEGEDSSCCCAICLDDFDDKEKVRVLPCGHKFHEVCLTPWLTERDASCPLCKMDVLKHVLELENKNKQPNSNGGDGDGEVDKERGASPTAEASGDEPNNPSATDNNNTTTRRNNSTSRGTSPVRSVWYRIRGWSLIADTAPSDHREETTQRGSTSSSSLEVLSEIEMEDRASTPTVNNSAEHAI